jgi:hypothetical protein
VPFAFYMEIVIYYASVPGVIARAALCTRDQWYATGETPLLGDGSISKEVANDHNTREQSRLGALTRRSRRRREREKELNDERERERERERGGRGDGGNVSRARMYYSHVDL